MLGTSNVLSDTDGDGFTDLEEFARQSEPTSAASIPLADHITVNIGSHGEGGYLHLFFAIYQPVGQYQSYTARIVKLQNSVLSSIPQSFLSRFGISEDYEIWHGGVKTGVVTTIDLEISPHAVPNGTSATWAICTTDSTTAANKSAAVVDIFNVDRVHCIRIRKEDPPGWAYAQQIQGSIYRPIPPSGVEEFASDWHRGQICMRASSTVATYANGIVVQEVVNADCETNWDTQCSQTACRSARSSTFQTIDPAVLMGN